MAGLFPVYFLVAGIKMDLLEYIMPRLQFPTITRGSFVISESKCASEPNIAQVTAIGVVDSDRKSFSQKARERPQIRSQETHLNENGPFRIPFS